MSSRISPRRRLPWPVLMGYSGLALPLAAPAELEAGLLTLAVLYALVPVGIKLVTTTLVWRFCLDATRQAELHRAIESGSFDVRETGDVARLA